MLCEYIINKGDKVGRDKTVLRLVTHLGERAAMTRPQKRRRLHLFFSIYFVSNPALVIILCSCILESEQQVFWSAHWTPLLLGLSDQCPENLSNKPTCLSFGKVVSLGSNELKGNILFALRASSTQNKAI